ncbi:D-alanyl-D-alanine carboxypeptidase/D-alanyl-D-alanine-endopeptidase [Cellulosimicrobium arenosum]|uniref:D-alanyl-D-alanine carboxypeptidase n=1 Tax=Cellulosimicrobium arenosum TaxID=2708133 RepID=A0A927IZ95_9MICO|nr:D-alanyl-D-alanine carboxypeptidase [Cellulosimicrobium arenosum]MBD8079131.1 D-alanyl-D-alanine carboxypeptidase [Cellulosimicrobium arenosum]
MGWGTRAGATVGVVLALVGGYLVADATDVVPGMLTTAPPPPEPAPFPDAPGAVAAPPLAVALPPLDDAATEPVADAVQAKVDDLVDDDRLGPRVGAVVTDAATGERLGAAATDAGHVPASTQKLLTAAAALTSPGAATTIPTTVLLDGQDDLYLVGGGDMMLAAGAGDPTLVNGRAGLADLAGQVADELRLTGRTTVTLRLDDTVFTGDAVSPSVFPGNVTAGYIAPVAALAVDVARLDDDEYARREADPALAAAQAFVEALDAERVTVEGDVTRARAPSAATAVGEVRSAPLGEVVDYLLQHSDNTITEVVGRLVAIDAGLPGSADAATRAVLATVGALGVDLDGAVLADCSGLGDGSVLTPGQLAAVVGLLVDPAHPELRSGAVGLPIAGLRGTLGDRFLDSAARGVARAKTGSLPDVTSLAGTVVTADDRLLVYTLMADEVPAGGTYGARVIFDEFVGGLAACGCTGG